MDFFYEKNGDAGFRNLDPLIASLIMLPFRVQVDGWEAIRKQFLSSRVKDDLAFTEDWQEYVEPEIMRLLGSCHQMVMSDLKKLEHSIKSHSQEKYFVLTIPSAHREAWLRMLNIVRLSLAAEHCFSDQEMQETSSFDVTSPRGKAFLQFRIFSILQQYLIEVESKEI